MYLCVSINYLTTLSGGVYLSDFSKATQMSKTSIFLNQLLINNKASDCISDCINANNMNLDSTLLDIKSTVDLGINITRHEEFRDREYPEGDGHRELRQGLGLCFHRFRSETMGLYSCETYTISVCVRVGTEKRKKNINHPHLTAAVFNKTGGHQRHKSLFWSVQSE